MLLQNNMFRYLHCDLFSIVALKHIPEQIAMLIYYWGHYISCNDCDFIWPLILWVFLFTFYNVCLFYNQCVLDIICSQIIWTRLTRVITVASCFLSFLICSQLGKTLKAILVLEELNFLFKLLNHSNFHITLKLLWTNESVLK